MTDLPRGRTRPAVGSAAAIRAELAALADPERAAGMARYLQARPGGYGEGERFLGSRCRRSAGLLGGTPGASLADVEA